MFCTVSSKTATKSFYWEKTNFFLEKNIKSYTAQILNEKYIVKASSSVTSKKVSVFKDEKAKPTVYLKLSYMYV